MVYRLNRTKTYRYLDNIHSARVLFNDVIKLFATNRSVSIAVNGVRSNNVYAQIWNKIDFIEQLKRNTNITIIHICFKSKWGRLLKKFSITIIINFFIFVLLATHCCQRRNIIINYVWYMFTITHFFLLCIQINTKTYPNKTVLKIFILYF